MASPALSSRTPIRASLVRGFSLVELIVVAGIITILTTLILVNNARFGGAITLRNLAYDIALTIRQAQVYGIAVVRHGTETFSAGYGMHFEIATPTSYVLYADAAIQNGMYDASGGYELVAATTIERGFEIGDLCSTDGVGVETCGLTQLDILFKRPEPDAYISTNGAPLSFNAEGDVIAIGLPRSARVLVVSPRGDELSVLVESTGQISVQ